MSHRRRSPLSPTVSAGAGVIAALAAVAAVVATVMIRNDSDDSNPQPVDGNVENLVKATVQIRAVDEQGAEAWSGSGSIINTDGLILTAAHLAVDPDVPYDHLEVAMTDHIDRAPDGEYRATVLAMNEELDLAVLKVDVKTPNFMKRGNQGSVDILDRVRILSYPATGGQTLTATTGSVSGFTLEESVHGPAWIKTDAAVTRGSSGGMAVNDQGALVGVVVDFGSGSDEADLVDCIAGFADTNGDGLWDEADGCVPAGGFINALRAVWLAEDLIMEAEKYDAAVDVPKLSPLPERAFGNLKFFDGFNVDGAPNEARDTLPSGATTICAVWDYSGMENGVRWDAVWWVDGSRYNEWSLAQRHWDGGQSGTAAPVCITENDGLPDGRYEFNLSVEGSFTLDGAIRVGLNDR